MRKLAPLAILALSACTPAQEALWHSWHAQDPRAAQEWAVNDCGALCSEDWDHDGVVEPDVSPQDTPPGGYGAPDHPGEQDSDSTASGRCAQWHGTAIGAGWSESDWPEVDKIMAAESGCNPNAYNPASGVTGLMQIQQFWASDCGGSPSDLYDPWFNLSCALHVKNVQGWQAWVTY